MSEPTTEAGRQMFDGWYPGHYDADDPEIVEFLAAICAIEAEARADLAARYLRELDWRDADEWEKTISQWLGPQRMSLLKVHELEHMAKGAVVAGAILRRLLDPSWTLREEALLDGALREKATP